jgi:DNA-binding transcriptional ArsR family regulator
MVYQEARLDAAFGALADPTRRAILSRLAEGERTISDLASRFAMSLPAVSKHVRVLERAGLTTVHRDGRVRRCRLRAAPLEDASVWIDRYRQYWEAGLDRLARYLDETITEEDRAWPTSRPNPPTPSKSAASSRPRVSGSSARGRKRKP